MSSLHVTFRSIPDAEKIEDQVNKRYEKLCKIHERITDCHVVIDGSHNHKQKGKLISMTTDLSIPGKELVSKKQSQNIQVVIREGFDALEKLLVKFNKRRVDMNKRRTLHPEMNTS